MIMKKKRIKSDSRGFLGCVSSSALAGAVEPLPKSYPAGAHHHAQRPPEAPPRRRAVKENKLEDEGEHHVDGPHQGHGSGLLYLQGLCEEGLAGDAQDGDQHEHPTIAAAERDLPFPEDGYSDDALD